MFNLIIATVCFSLSFGLIKTQLVSLPSEFVVFFRLLLAGILFIPFIKLSNIRKHLFAAVVGVVQFGIMYLCFINAFKYLQGNEVALLTTTTPIFVALWSTLFGAKFKFIYIVCILMSVLGAGIIVWQNLSFTEICKGVILMETCNCSFALGQVLWKKFINDTSAKYMSSAYLGACLLVAPILLFNDGFNILNTLTIEQILSLLYLALVPTGIGFFLWNKGSVKVKYSTLAIMNNLKIPFAVFFSIIIFQEKINLLNFIIGSAIILFAAIILHFSNLKDSKNECVCEEKLF